jgi:hypothetical protein
VFDKTSRLIRYRWKSIDMDQDSQGNVVPVPATSPSLSGLAAGAGIGKRATAFDVAAGTMRQLLDELEHESSEAEVGDKGKGRDVSIEKSGDNKDDTAAKSKAETGGKREAKQKAVAKVKK